MKLLDSIQIQYPPSGLGTRALGKSGSNESQEIPSGFALANWNTRKAPKLADVVRQWPGVRFQSQYPRGTLVPLELVPRLRIAALEHGLSAPEARREMHNGSASQRSTADGHFMYQQDASTAALAQNGLLINFDTGLGKCATAILALQERRPNRTLIICPAIVRRHWQRELLKWWPSEAQSPRMPEAPNAPSARFESSNAPSARSPTLGNPTLARPVIRLIETGKDWTSPSACEIVITSYELVPEAPSKWDAIVIDESHYIKEAEASRSIRIKKHCHMNASALKLALTATPIANEPMDIWNQVHCLWPGRFGSYSHFLKRYAVKTTNDFGSKWGGLNEDTALELRERVAGLSAQATRQQYAHLLPRFTTESLYVPALKKHRFNWLQDTALFDKHLEATADAKLLAIQEALASESASTAVFTYRVAYAKDLAAKLLAATGRRVFLITGEDSHKERDETIQQVQATPGCLLVASMKSIGIGIDLNGFALAYFLELYYSPAVMLQALGRFTRLSGSGSTKITFVIAQGTLDESVVAGLEPKLRAINSALGSPTASTLADMIATTETEDQFKARLREIAADQFSGYYS